jgi:outer membrane murein-binding lipoprotein Lpp
MKITFLKSALMVAVLATGLCLTSCKNKANNSETTTTEVDTLNGGGAPESPIDTIVKDNDTIIDTGGASDAKENPAGTQVP